MKVAAVGSRLLGGPSGPVGAVPAKGKPPEGSPERTTMAAPPDLGFATLGDLEEAGRRRVPGPVWDYIQGGAESERTLAANRAAITSRFLLPRALRDTAVVDPTTTLLGRSVRAPFYVAPTAYHGSIHPDAELGTARAATAAGVLGVFSTLSSRSLEEIGVASGEGVRWFQLYLQPDPRQTDALLDRAERAGYAAIVLTVDAPLLAGRDRQVRTGFAWDTPAALGNGPEIRSPARRPELEGPRYRFRSENAATWRIIGEIRSRTRLPVVVKGIVAPDDARRAMQAGARAVIVSNHGGRQLDGAVASLDALPGVVEAVGDRIEVLVDGGFRRGSDLLVALALGARGIGLGRPVLWALAAGGEAGVRRALEMLRMELAVDLALAGCRSIAEVDRSLLFAPGEVPRRSAGTRPRPPRRIAARATVKRRRGSRRRSA